MTATEQLVAALPYARELGVRLQSASPEAVAGSLAWTPKRCTAGGAVHGGVIMSLADSLGGICAFLNVAEGAHTTTIESKTNFLRPLRAGAMTARAVPVHVGRTTIVVQTETRDEDGLLVALTTQTQAVVR